jgi:F-type H+-transporting ATPase subunit b
LSIDWVTVVAQTVNFLVLVWLLHRFLYAPITKAVRARDTRIQERLDEVAESRRILEAEDERLKSEWDRLSQQRTALLAKAQAEASETKAALEQQARTDAAELRETWRREIEGEREAFIANFQQGLTRQFFVVAREAIGSLAGQSLDDALVDRFAQNLGDLDPRRLQALQNEVEQEHYAVTFASSHALSNQARERLESVARDQLSPKIQITYVVDESLSFGVELIIGGQTISWGLEGYFKRLEERMLVELAHASTAPTGEPLAFRIEAEP